MRFEKWQALGNDYVIVERGRAAVGAHAGAHRAHLRPHFGIGSDGVLLLSRAATIPDYVAELRIFNPDGSEAELSGNGAREAVLYLRARGWTDADDFSILTRAGAIRPTITGRDTATLEMGRASVTSPDYPSGGPDGAGTLRPAGASGRFQHVSIGNPQCAIEVGRGARGARPGRDRPGDRAQRAFPEPHERLVHRGWTGSTVRARIFERGVGETLSSGTGASGAAVAALLRGAASPITVALDGGELDRRDLGRSRRDAHRDRPSRCSAASSPSDLRELGELIAEPAGSHTLPADDHLRDQARADRPVEAPRRRARVHVRRARAAGRGQARGGRRRDQPRDRRPGPTRPTRTSSRRCRPRSPTPPTTATRPTAAARSSGTRSPRSTTERFGVEIDPETEVIPAIGAKECIYNLCFAFLDPGDVALAADPGYPVYTGGPVLAGAEAVLMPLAPELGLRAGPRRDLAGGPGARAPDVRQLPEQPDRRRGPGRLLRAGGRASHASTRSSSSTTTPTRRRPTTDTSPRASSPRPGAKEVGVEVFSLSKGFNMTGWRCAAILGNADAISSYWRLKTNVDSGLFEAVQLAGAAALAGPARADRGDERDLRPPPRPGGGRAARDRRRGRAAARGRSTSGHRCPRATPRSRSPSWCSRRRPSSSRPGRCTGRAARASSGSR